MGISYFDMKPVVFSLSPGPSRGGRLRARGRVAPPTACSRACFNVVELVVILTTLIGLASLLAPVLYRGGLLARSGVCAQNQRQLFVWIGMYAHASEGILPPYEDGWVARVARSAGAGVDQGAAPQEQFACPSQESAAGSAGYWRGTHYGLNQHLASKLRDAAGDPFPQWSIVNVKKVKDPTGKLLLADAAGGNYFDIPGRDPVVAGISRHGRGYPGGLPPQPATPLPALRHLDGSGNFLFIDGHGEVRQEWPEFMLGPGSAGYAFWHAEHWYPGCGFGKPAPKKGAKK